MFIKLFLKMNKDMMKKNIKKKTIRNNSKDIAFNSDDCDKLFLEFKKNDTQLEEIIEYAKVLQSGDLKRIMNDYVINEYSDKNKHINSSITAFSNEMFSSGYFNSAEKLWLAIDGVIDDFNKEYNTKFNRGIALANIGIAQIAEDRVVDGLCNLYNAHVNDRESVKHLFSIDPETMPSSVLFTQFEKECIGWLYNKIFQKFKHVFLIFPSKQDVNSFVNSLQYDKKIFLFLIFWRFKKSYFWNASIKNFISRSEILRSLSDLAVWYEDELKKKDTLLFGKTLGQCMINKFGDYNNGKQGKYSKVNDLVELKNKTNDAFREHKDIVMQNVCVMSLVRNFSGHNFQVEDKVFFDISDEIFSRMFALIIESNRRGII